MVCKQCGGQNVNIQMTTKVKKKRGNIFYWIFVKLWVELIMWFFLTLPWLIIKIFKPAKYKSKVEKYAVCQDCGHSWKI